MMQLTSEENAMLDGAQGRARQRAMELLVRYGEALGAERLVETNNVATTVAPSGPLIRPYATRGMDHVFSEFNLDSDEVVGTPPMAAHTCQLIQGIDESLPEMREAAPEAVPLQRQGEEFFGRRGVTMHSTCTPYQLGTIPVFGEHCAWMESSAVVYCNAVLGARTNTEGRESTGAASITRRIPYWGYHLPENRYGTHLIDVEHSTESMMDWGLLGYWLGEAVEEDIPVLRGALHRPALESLKHFGAAAASSGGVEMYHIIGVTPEAPSLDAAFGGRAPRAALRYTAADRRRAYENLNTSASTGEVDFIMLGCPHNSAAQVAEVARLLEGRRISANTQLWVFTPRALREVAEHSGHAAIIRAAGGQVVSDTCPAISRIMPKGTRVVATDSAKQAHYLPAITGVETWFGSLADCVRAAIDGRWSGSIA